MDDCIFCKIVKREIKAEIKKETDNFIVIPDIKPSAKTHLLIITKNHVSDLKFAEDNLLVEAKNLALDLQNELSLDEFQFRVNWGKLLEVNHLHFHFMANFN
ncbi:MAG: Histidine triad (HIT) protein [Candidatus Woesebacteria bacterium GW2011_GWA1_33_30]|uniref:Histidine triad (HIT) protein n=1 Tax=Candidatus Woesebacteria bacterium GW2011_GWA2_33_28 TaxID=1618561 RepID=A0A0G0CX41_9BACT|nr:MAG: Histidine triad (HIT) protein [Candidatus Woesebacteria bacterium GW2011_GWA2_33_28]KKP48790.1 MAG: Histidine triad (HIT) protein [Candidatus Woesebacteria bacterium GW2011_GWA1_33_30]KKP50063.1 MAG: Histidine triad (HIT) protein [Microgenomates group bacterium GW2011_GWC1_33_32]KKP51834.1 MAG: Histidine triad (HIT) protein [Candidatus Woesebacteria bacterium GW2011_GWB1_33_38]KKP57834.1 MAG: Histidine triad (HIT) protein [Microgenomates group bacterium GW2011_GWD1_33_9]